MVQPAQGSKYFATLFGAGEFDVANSQDPSLKVWTWHGLSQGKADTSRHLLWPQFLAVLGTGGFRVALLVRWQEPDDAPIVLLHGHVREHSMHLHEQEHG